MFLPRNTFVARSVVFPQSRIYLILWACHIPKIIYIVIELITIYVVYLQFYLELFSFGENNGPMNVSTFGEFQVRFILFWPQNSLWGPAGFFFMNIICHMVELSSQQFILHGFWVWNQDRVPGWKYLFLVKYYFPLLFL